MIITNGHGASAFELGKLLQFSNLINEVNPDLRVVMSGGSTRNGVVHVRWLPPAGAGHTLYRSLPKALQSESVQSEASQDRNTLGIFQNALHSFGLHDAAKHVGMLYESGPTALTQRLITQIMEQDPAFSMREGSEALAEITAQLGNIRLSPAGRNTCDGRPGISPA